MKFKSSDIKPGDHLVWVATNNNARLEVVVVNVDHVNRCWTHLYILSDHRPECEGEFYTTSESSPTSWELVWDNAEIVSRAK